MATAPGPSCGGVKGGRACDFYRPNNSQHVEAARAIGVAMPAGQCWRYPAPVERKSEDLCGEHQAVRGYWIGVLAREIAEQVMHKLDAALKEARTPETVLGIRDDH